MQNLLAYYLAYANEHLTVMKEFKVEGIPYSHQWHSAAGVTYRGWPLVVLEAVVVYYVQDDNVWRSDLDDLKGIRVPVRRVYRLQNCTLNGSNRESRIMQGIARF